MRIEATGPGTAEIVIEVGDRVALADAHTREIVAEVKTVQQLPCKLEWMDLRVGRRDRWIGWALLAEEDDELLYIGDAMRVNSGDRYTLEVPYRGTATPETRAELSVWRDERIVYRLRVDPRCLTVEAVRGGATRPTVRHVDPCTCGVF